MSLTTPSTLPARSATRYDALSFSLNLSPPETFLFEHFLQKIQNLTMDDKNFHFAETKGQMRSDSLLRFLRYINWYLLTYLELKVSDFEHPYVFG